MQAQHDIEAQQPFVQNQNFTMDPSQYGADQTDTEYAETKPSKKFAANPMAMAVAGLFGLAIVSATLSSLFVCCNWSCKMPFSFCCEMCVKTSLWNVITLDACTFVPCALCLGSDGMSPACSCPNCCQTFCLPTLFCTSQEGFHMKLMNMAKAMVSSAMGDMQQQMKMGGQQYMNANMEQYKNTMNSYNFKY